MESMPILRASIFRSAARRVANIPMNVGACWGIYKADGHQLMTHEHQFFNAVLRPKGSYGWWYDDVGPKCKDVKTARVLGLLLCAELVEDGWTL